ncbi:T9SS type A sorting domain-containing protein [Lewinella sp. IMCC34183]|uniref:T9SS type A sorting domain-containing protein n=1 Tax=Lewinella sp. IMCC34183 TaxID=2248762 RepID=UPI000E26445F|nr:T9SS type A sorting domain-containing protein [Lewinella sp. IMCC34183]
MKQLLLAIAFLLGCTIYSYGQSCTYTITNSDAFCRSSCSTTFEDTEGSLTGTITVDISGNGNVFAFPIACGEFELSVGALTLIVGAGEKVVISRVVGDNIVGIQPNADAVNFTLIGLGNANGIGSNVSRLEFRGIEYVRGAARNNFADAQEAIRQAASALPVDLYYWNAQPEQGTASLTWATTAETDNDHFVIEHSTDGRTFTELATVKGKGSYEGITTYSYIDAAPATGQNLYRLSQVDFDGTRTVYDVRGVSFGTDARSVAFPNPARAGQYVNYQVSAQVTEVTLHSITGREVGRYPAVGGLTLPTDLPAGMYMLRAGQSTTRLLVRQ